MKGTHQFTADVTRISYSQYNVALKLSITGSYHSIINKTEVESVQLGNTYIADMDKCPQDKCCGDSCNLLYMFPGPFV